MSDNHPRLRWVARKIRTGPTDERTLTGSAIAMWLYWRLWAGIITLLVAWAYAIYMTGGSTDTVVGFMAGLFGAMFASEVMDND